MTQELDDDEVFVLLIGIIASIAGAIRWYWSIASFAPFRSRASLWAVRFLFAVAPVMCVAALIPFLHAYAAKDVRDDPTYLLLFTALGGAWISGALALIRALGISPRDDALERGNIAAAIVTVATIIATTIVYALANVGEGATIWMTIGPAALATLALAALWVLFQLITRFADAITIDRDVAASIRFAGLLIANALVLGHSVAGDYVSVQATLNDFALQGWPAIAMTIAAAIVHFRFRASPSNPKPNLGIAGVVPGISFIALGLLATKILKRI